MPTDTSTTGTQEMSWQDIFAAINGGMQVFVEGIGNINQADAAGNYTTTEGTSGTVPPNATFDVTPTLSDDPAGYLAANPMFVLLLLVFLWMMSRK